METITVQAVYEKGVLKPRKKLNLPEHSLVEIKVKNAKALNRGAFGSLIGIWENLPASERKEIERSLANVRKRTKARLKKLSGKR
ncbi:MAG: antitoxin family protein [Chloroflexota bacterium]